ncbi:MAG TPA: cytochrome c nitrite reductase small subunit [Lentimicrobium sp.]|nr:cytochrome c nitrite reductase small subunit [Lentimicrobium sp.]
MRKVIKFFGPPDNWRLPVIILSGTLVGILILLIYTSRAHSYLSDNPQTCINCHVMNPQYATWMHSSHKESATCNDCHVPHDNIFRTYFFKAKDGLRHATIFTARREPQVIQIKEAGINVVQENCIRCHKNLIDYVSLIQVTGENHAEGAGHRCWDCHRETPHGTVNSLASTPYSLVPRMKSIVPDWMKGILEEKPSGSSKTE